jgi:hypothetical protein
VLTLGCGGARESSRGSSALVWSGVALGGVSGEGATVWVGLMVEAEEGGAAGLEAASSHEFKGFLWVHAIGEKLAELAGATAAAGKRHARNTPLLRSVGALSRRARHTPLHLCHRARTRAPSTPHASAEAPSPLELSFTRS